MRHLPTDERRQQSVVGSYGPPATHRDCPTPAAWPRTTRLHHLADLRARHLRQPDGSWKLRIRTARPHQRHASRAGPADPGRQSCRPVRTERSPDIPSYLDIATECDDPHGEAGSARPKPTGRSSEQTSSITRRLRKMDCGSQSSTGRVDYRLGPIVSRLSAS